MLGLFKKKTDPRPAVTIHLTARLQPMHRGEMFEDPLDMWLRESGLGEVCGGGTEFDPGAGIKSCDIEVRVNAVDDATLTQLAEQLRAMHAPMGSKLVVHDDGREIAVGGGECLALHLNGTDLADDVYDKCSPIELIDLLNGALGARGKFMSHWDGETETTLFLYGASYAEMKEAIARVVANYPLCERARIEKIG